MLDTIRQYAREKLLESGEAAALRERHWQWFLALAEQAEPELHGPEQAAWLERLEREHDNLRAALEWGETDGRPGTGDGGPSLRSPVSGLPSPVSDLPSDAAAARLAAALWRFWLMRGHLSEGRGWLERIIAGGEECTPRFATLLHGAGALACQQEDLTAAGALLERSVSLWRALGDEREVASSLVWLGRVPLGKGDHAGARSLFEESLHIFRQLGDKRGIARSVNNLGEVERDEGDYERAGALYAESLALGRETGHQGIIAISLHNLGQVALHRDDFPRAAALFRESLGMFHELGDRRAIGACLAGLAAVALATHPTGEEPGAARLLGAAGALLEELGAPLPPADRAAYERCVAAARARLGEERFAMAWAEGRAMSLERVMDEAMQDA
jgi:non-specific serine/threonine protein kinase